MCRYRAYYNVGSRTHGRDTFFCFAKRKYPKKRRPDAACFLRSVGFIGVCQKGHPFPSGKVRLPAAPLRAIPNKTASTRRGITGMGAYRRVVGWIRRAK
jgi:hypothetical protein